jgi:histidinol dehydrogenase
MNEKIIRNLIIALVGILAIYGLLRWQQDLSYVPAKPAGFNFKAITKKLTSEVEVKSQKANYVLAKKDDKWFMDSKKVDSSAIDELFNGLKDADVEQLATAKKEKLASLGLDEKSSKQISFQTKNGKFSFIIGKQSIDGSGFYVQLPKDKNKAYLASGSLGTVFTKKASDWLEKEKPKKK